jgi:chromatin structure-remodeling complex subunit SFH1
MNTFASPVRTSLPQSFITTYAPRLRSFGNSLITPVVHQAPLAPSGRSTKRATAAINYAEDGYDDEDFYDSENPRRPTGLRSLRRDDSALERTANTAHLGKEATGPVDVQGIWRDWMAKPKKLL